nr:restriction endonuclease subunit S [Ruthenibacterium lactatiformans]
MNKTIKDISLEIGSGITPLRSNELYWNSPDIPWIKTEQLGQYKIFDSTEYISNFALEDTNIRLWSPRTVSVAMYGEGKTRGNASILMIETATNQACCNIKVNDALADYRFLYYWLKNNYENLRTLSAGVRKNLNADDIKNFPFPENSLPEQEKIADILSVVDDKIELNSKICSELESMAKTLYDYWFVQFDFPDENGKPYRTSDGAMEWNDQLKREIPKGWEPGKLCDIANITMGQSPAGESYNDDGDGLIFYQGRTDFGLRFPTPRMYTTAPTRFAQKGDILLSVRAPVGDLNFAMEYCCIGRGLAALNSKLGSQMHLFYTLAGFQQIFKVMDGNGTTFGSITKDTLFDMSVVIPPDEILKCFEKRVKPIESKIEKCEEEIRELTKLRDWLLPMLMNGQARVE